MPDQVVPVSRAEVLRWLSVQIARIGKVPDPDRRAKWHLPTVGLLRAMERNGDGQGFYSLRAELHDRVKHESGPLSYDQMRHQDAVRSHLTELANHPARFRADLERGERALADGPAQPAEPAALIAEAGEHANGSVLVYTVLPSDVPVRTKYAEGVTGGNGSYRSFGDGASGQDSLRVTYNWGRELQASRDRELGVVEAVGFSPATESVVSKPSVVKRPFFLPDKKVPGGRIIGSRQPTVPGRDGQPEPAVDFGYCYDPSNAGGYIGAAEERQGLPTYHNAQEDTFTGNRLYVEARLPESVARELEAAIKERPEVAREFAEHLVTHPERGGLPHDVWKQGLAPAFRPQQPPYPDKSHPHRIHQVSRDASGRLQATPLEWAPAQTRQPSTGVDVQKFISAGSGKHDPEASRPGHADATGLAKSTGSQRPVTGGRESTVAERQ